MIEQVGNKYLNWGLYCVALGALALKANTVTVMVFIIITFVLSLKKPLFSICSFQCALIANSYLGDFYYLNLALCGIVIVSFIYYVKSFRFLDKRDVPLIVAFIYSMILSVTNGFDNILVVAIFMLIVEIARVMCRCNIISLKEIIISMAITSCFSGVVGLMSNAYGLSYGAGSVSRFLSSYGDPNFFCMFSVAAIVGLVYFKASKLKVAALNKINKNSIQYIGIAYDEPQRFKVLRDKKISPLVEAEWTEKMCYDWCKENDLLSPIYQNTTRGGCWFCHNQSVAEMRYLRHNYPKYWKLLLKWDKDSPTLFTVHHTVEDYDKRFQLEDLGLIFPDDTRFRWKWVEEYFDKTK